MKVLSLCDGMSCGQIALEQLGIKFDTPERERERERERESKTNVYYASEIKEVAKKVTQYNYPNTVQIGDVNNISYKDGILHTENGDYETEIDMVIFGSPCQSFSISIKTDMRIGLEDKKRSGLFLECLRILNEVKPKYFLMENVASMRDSDRDKITEYLGVSPIMINSSLVSPCLRKRYYWTNIPNITQPNVVDIKFQDILDDGYTNREKGVCLTVVSCNRPNSTPVKLFHRFHKSVFLNLIFKSKEHYEQCVEYYDTHYKGLSAKEIPINETDIFNGVRVLNQTEMEKCQTVPLGYTKCLTQKEAGDVLGDGWTIDVIKHIFSFIPNLQDM